MKFLNRLSTHNHETAWKQARKNCTPGAAVWITRNNEFEGWIKAEFSSVLWCSGGLGCGKSVLTYGILQRL